MKSKNALLSGAAVAVLACGSMTSLHAAEANRFTMRFRAIYIDPADESTAIPALAAPQDAIDIESKWAPDIDFEYALTERIGLELLLTIPQRHDVTLKQSALGTNVDLGTVDHLPPTLTAKYYFLTRAVRPYLGAGLNFTYFTDDNLLNGALDVKRSSFGPALQAGMDIYTGPNWSISVDVKKVWIETDVSMSGVKLTTVNVDPLIYGIGVGYRFGGGTRID